MYKSIRIISLVALGIALIVFLDSYFTIKDLIENGYFVSSSSQEVINKAYSIKAMVLSLGVYCIAGLLDRDFNPPKRVIISCIVGLGSIVAVYNL